MVTYGGICEVHDWKVHRSLRTQMRFFTPLSCDLEPDITKPNPRKIVVSSDLDLDTSTSFGSGGVTYQGFRGPFILNSSCHDFEKVEKGKRVSSQMWVRMAGYQKYISSTYSFISDFVSLIKYAGTKLNNLIWLHMAGYLNYIPFRYVFILSFVSLTKYAGRKLNNLMWLRMAREFIIIYIVWYGLRSQLWLRMEGY